jgi:hypothetical protein
MHFRNECYFRYFFSIFIDPNKPAFQLRHSNMRVGQNTCMFSKLLLYSLLYADKKKNYDSIKKFHKYFLFFQAHQLSRLPVYKLLHNSLPHYRVIQKQDFFQSMAQKFEVENKNNTTARLTTGQNCCCITIPIWHGPPSWPCSCSTPRAARRG